MTDLIKAILFIALVYTAFVLDTVGVGGSRLGVEPRWLLLAATAGVWMFRPALAIVAAGVIGLLMDGLAEGSMGLHVIAVGTFCWLAAMLQQRIRMTTPIGYFAIAFLVVAGTALTEILAQRLVVGTPIGSGWQRIATTAAAQGAASAVYGTIILIVLLSVRRVYRWVVPEPLSWRKEGSVAGNW